MFSPLRRPEVLSVTLAAAGILMVTMGTRQSLGLFISHGVHAIDTGAVWGGKLTALQLDTDELRIVQVPGREVATPGVEQD